MPRQVGSVFDLPQVATPSGTPATGREFLYFKSDGLLYRKTTTGEFPVDTTSGAAQPAYRGEWTTVDGQSIGTSVWGGRFGWQPDDATQQPVGILDSRTAGVNPGEFQVINAGFYQINLALAFSNDGTALRQFRVVVNGTNEYQWSMSFAGAGQPTGSAGSFSIYLPANSIIAPQGWQNTGANLAWNTDPVRNRLSIFSLGQGPKGDTGGNPYTPAPVIQGVSTSSVNATNSTWLTVSGWSGLDNVNNPYISGTSGGVSTVKLAGMYLIMAQACFSAGTAGRRAVRLFKNNTTEVMRQDNSSAGQQWNGVVTAMVPLAIGDTMEVDVFQTSGGNLALGGNPGHTQQWWRMSTDLAYSTATTWP